MSRNKNKGPFFKVNFIPKNKRLKTHYKNITILPEYVNNFVQVYNGKTFINLKINSKMIGFKLGEFINTRKKHIYKKKKK